jgi:hypothetical protein
MEFDRVRQAIESLDYDFQQFELKSLLQRVQTQRQRQITCVGYPFHPGLTGLWIPASAVDYIFYAQNTHPMHQIHIILHELAHIVLKHRCQPLEEILPPELLKQLQGTAATGRSRQIQLQFTEDEQEQESEFFVFLIQTEIVRARRMMELTGELSSIAAFSQFASGMGFVG